MNTHTKTYTQKSFTQYGKEAFQAKTTTPTHTKTKCLLPATHNGRTRGGLK
ncbi:hypothetical protein Mapa_002782 [Marchantia paleacea]|nr:hypothetical protein Mapa_002782 [Marchantia paleacea]